MGQTGEGKEDRMKQSEERRTGWGRKERVGRTGWDTEKKEIWQYEIG